MFYSTYEISIMTKGHTEEIKRSCKMCNNKKYFSNLKAKKLINVLIISKIYNLFK